MKLTEQELSKALSTLQGWTRQGDSIQRVSSCRHLPTRLAS
jgi:hypothetical protein